MKRASLISVSGALLLLAGCASKRLHTAPAAPPPGAASSPQAAVPAAVAPPRKSAKPIAPPGPPAPQTARAPLTLESRGDPLPERGSVETRIRDAQAALTQLNARTLAGSARDDRERAAAMLDLAQKALARGDLRQADDLSARAAMLAKTLLNAH